MIEKVKNILRKPYHGLKKLLSLSFYKTQLLQRKRRLERERNNYDNPRRVLLYVIYENQTSLQKYKLIFLKELAKLTEKVLIIVNGSLPSEDVQQLKAWGEVVQRENNGYDAAAFRAGCLKLLEDGIEEYDELVIVNDTSVGPFKNLETVFRKMSEKQLDFWGISYGGQSPDVTGFNRYGYIPKHLQSYFLVIEKSMFNDLSFYQYWQELGETTTRDMAIGKHETVFTKYFEDLGFIHDALSHSNLPGAIYFHPLTLIREDDVPIVKYTALENTSDIRFAWHGYSAQTEIPDLLEYIQNKTDYPFFVIDKILDDLSKKVYPSFILVIYEQEDEELKKQITRLEEKGETVKLVKKSVFHLSMGEHAKAIVFYFTEELEALTKVATMAGIPVFDDFKNWESK